VTAVHFGSKDAADAVREDYRDALCPDDDRRLKTVRFASDAPEHVVNDAQRQADQSRADRESGPGQADLTDTERERIDFSEGRVSIPHARSVKAIARSEGVDDWTAFYDPTLTVDEHRDVMEQAARDESGRRLDEETSPTVRAGEAAARAEAEECDHARDHCVNGDPDACEFLTQRCGFDQSEIEQYLDDDGDQDGITGREADALDRAWSGYKGATARMESAVESFREEWQHAQQAAQAINGIREAHDQTPIHFERLEDIQGQLADLTREAAADCHECHANHSEHDHVVLDDEREDLRALAEPTGDPAESQP